MKKFFFFLILLLFPIVVSAGSIQNLEVKNGTLSRKFESNNNIYSVILYDGEQNPIFDYDLSNENCSVEIEDTDNITQIHVTLDNNLKETYTFYVEKEEDVPVFKEFSNDPENVKVAFAFAQNILLYNIMATVKDIETTNTILENLKNREYSVQMQEKIKSKSVEKDKK